MAKRPITSSSCLPPDIIETILTRLSVKPLLRFKSVSKSWNSIISDPLFHKIHHQKSLVNSSHPFIIRRGQTSTVLNLEDQKIEIVRQLETPSSNCTIYICHCPGMLLLTNASFDRYVLWNPSTRTKTEFSMPFKGTGYGVCRHPITHDIKAVFMMDRHYCVVSFSKEYKYKPFTIEKKEYKYKSFSDCGPCFGTGYIFQNRGVCVDGAIYWAWFCDKHGMEIVYYDPRDDNFKILKTPKNLERGKWISLVDLLGGYLCMYCEGQRKTNSVKMWIKKKGIDNNSWNEFIIIENLKMHLWNFVPVCLMGNKIVIRDKHVQKLMVYSPLEKTFEQCSETSGLQSS